MWYAVYTKEQISLYPYYQWELYGAGDRFSIAADMADYLLKRGKAPLVKKYWFERRVKSVIKGK